MVLLIIAWLMLVGGVIFLNDAYQDCKMTTSPPKWKFFTGICLLLGGLLLCFIYQFQFQ